MKFVSLLAGLLLPLVATARPHDSYKRQTLGGPCKDYHMFMARGAGDSYPGSSGALPPLVCKGVVSCDYEDILYVGTFDKVCSSVEVGVTNATQQIKSYGQRCPNATLALIGHSEGSAVILNTLGGGGSACPGGTMKTTSPNDANTGVFKQIKAIALTGDLRHTANQPYNVGTGAAKNGIWTRTSSELTGLQSWESKIRSWCEDSDPVCAGGNNVSTHGSYMQRSGQEIANWMRKTMGISSTKSR